MVKEFEQNVRIVASTVTINVAVSGTVQVNIASISTGVTFNVAIQSSAVTLNVAIQSSAVTLNVAIASSVTLNVNIASQGAFNLNVAIASSAVTLQVNIASQTSNLNVNLAASAITLNVNISSQSAFNLNVNIAASAATLQVNIASQSANLNINIAASSATITIQGSGTNIILDKLTQGATAPRPETTITVSNQTASIDLSLRLRAGYGFFIARGCRGTIRAIKIWIRNTHATSAQNAVIKVNPFPNGAAYTHTWTESIPANSSALRTTWAVNYGIEYWKYDGLFVWVDLTASGANIEVGHENATKTFLQYRAASNATIGGTPTFWDFGNDPYSENASNVVGNVAIYILTVGDLPVSGIVNNIAIPNTAVSTATAAVSIPNNTESILATIYGAGRLRRIYFRAEHSDVELRVFVDGARVRFFSSDYADSFTQFDALGYTTSRHYAFINMLFYTASAACGLDISLPIEFQKSFQVRAYNGTGAARDVRLNVLTETMK